MRFKGLWSLLLVSMVSGCATNSSPEVSSYAQLHTGLENKVHDVSFYGDRPTKSYIGLQSQWDAAEDVEVVLSVEGTLNRKNGVLGKNDVPFDRTANVSVSKEASMLRLGRSKMLRAKYSLTSSMRSYSSALWEDYPIETMRLDPYLSETLTSSLYWQQDSETLPVRMQTGRFDAGVYGAAEVGLSAIGTQGALMFEAARFEDPSLDALRQLSYNGVLEDDWGWNAWEVWGAQAEGWLLGGRFARGFEIDRMALQFSYACMTQAQYDFSRRYFDEDYVFGRNASLVSMDLLWRADLYNEFNLSLQNAKGVAAETPLDTEVFSGLTAQADVPRNWLVGLGWERRAEDDSVWRLSASMMNTLSESPSESYFEWGAQSLWEIPLGQQLDVYMGTAWGQGGFGGDLLDYSEYYIGLQSRF